MGDYYLPQHIFVSVLEESCIWLDVRLDKFHCTSKEECQCLFGLVEGWPLAESAQVPVDTKTGEAREVAEALTRQGLLTRSRNGKSAAPPRVKFASRAVGELAN